MTDALGHPLADGDRVAATPHLLIGDILTGSLSITDGEPVFIPDNPAHPTLRHHEQPGRIRILHTNRQVIKV